MPLCNTEGQSEFLPTELSSCSVGHQALVPALPPRALQPPMQNALTPAATGCSCSRGREIFHRLLGTSLLQSADSLPSPLTRAPSTEAALSHPWEHLQAPFATHPPLDRPTRRCSSSTISLCPPASATAPEQAPLWAETLLPSTWLTWQCWTAGMRRRSCAVPGSRCWRGWLGRARGRRRWSWAGRRARGPSRCSARAPCCTGWWRRSRSESAGPCC